MPDSTLNVITLSAESPSDAPYDNHPVAQVNDHEIRISTMTEPYHWHAHPNSDETFLALEGGLFIDFDDHTVELRPGQIITIPGSVRHRTRPIGSRSVNLTFERTGTQTNSLPAPDPATTSAAE